MQKILIDILENNYFQSPLDTNITLLLSNYSEILPHVCYFNLLLGYGGYLTVDVDLFQYFKINDIEQLRNDKNTVLFFDCTFEGYSEEIETLAKTFENCCAKHNIDPRKIFILTGNLEDIKFNTLTNVISIFLLHSEFQEKADRLFTIDQSKLMCSQLLSKLILSLSRRNRAHRVHGHYMLSRSAIFDDCIISQDKIDDFYMDADTVAQLGGTLDDFNNFRNRLPIIADGDNFHINSPYGRLLELHCSTVFSIVNETLCINHNNTSLFYSEKFLKPILNFQPMLLWGQQGINKRLSMLGFKTYESYFDLEFDDEPDNVIRYKKLLTSATHTVNYLKSLTKDQQIEWRYKESQLLEYNHNMIFNKILTIAQLNKIVTRIKSVIT